MSVKKKKVVIPPQDSRPGPGPSPSLPDVWLPLRASRGSLRALGPSPWRRASAIENKNKDNYNEEMKY